ncbi:MAG: hypothetical protein SPL15_01335, partial [Lachnospiraceae bacterium]|nr:hypothetical protein [Lachnospiraceae bacterium]
WLDAKGNVVPWPEGVEIRVRVLKVNADGNTLAKEITIASSEAVIVDGLDKTAVYQVEEAGVTNGEIKIGDTGYTVTIGGSTVTNRAKPVNEEPNNSDGDNPDNPGGDNPGNNDPDNPGGNRPDSPSETTPSKPNEADSGSRVNTGDKSNIAAYVILLASSFMLMTFVIVMKRTRGRKK